MKNCYIFSLLFFLSAQLVAQDITVGSNNTAGLSGSVFIRETPGGNGFFTAVARQIADPTLGISEGALFGFNGSFSNFYGIGLGALRNSNYDIWFQTGAINGGGYRFYKGIDELMTLTNSGSLGIGTNSPLYKVDVNGDIRADRYYYDISATLLSSSDKLLKKNITEIDGVLEKILRLRPVNFEWNDTKLNLLSGRKSQIDLFGIHEGLIAQEVELIFPSYVKTDADGYKAVSYVSFILPIIKAIQEQQDVIDKLRYHIMKLESDISKYGILQKFDR